MSLLPEDVLEDSQELLPLDSREMHNNLRRLMDDYDRVKIPRTRSLKPIVVPTKNLKEEFRQQEAQMSKKLVDWVNIDQLLRNAEPKKILQ